MRIAIIATLSCALLAACSSGQPHPPQAEFAAHYRTETALRNFNTPKDLATVYFVPIGNRNARSIGINGWSFRPFFEGFSAVCLPAGTYSIEYEAPGFASNKAEFITVKAGDVRVRGINIGSFGDIHLSDMAKEDASPLLAAKRFIPEPAHYFLSPGYMGHPYKCSFKGDS